MATAQVKDAIIRLKAAGLKRRQFSAQVELIYAGLSDKGQALYEYGYVCISLKNMSKVEQLEMAPAIAKQGFNVTVYILKDGTTSYPHVMEPRRDIPAGLYYYDFRKLDEYGFPILVEAK